MHDEFLPLKRGFKATGLSRNRQERRSLVGREKSLGITEQGSELNYLAAAAYNESNTRWCFFPLSFHLHTRSMRTGFTLIELLVVIAIIVICSVITVTSLTGKKNSNDLSLTVSQVTALLREAQSRSVTQTQGATWGVHFSNTTTTAPFYAMFSSSYSPTTTGNYYRLPPDVAYATSTIPSGSAVDVIFNQVSGVPSGAASIGFLSLSQASLSSSTISVMASGAIMY